MAISRRRLLASAAAVLSGGEGAALTARDRALADWARKVVADPNSTTRDDVQALRATGLDDRAIFEATAFIAFRLAFSTVNDALGAAPDWQLVHAAPQEVSAAVTYGRAPQAVPPHERDDTDDQQRHSGQANRNQHHGVGSG